MRYVFEKGRFNPKGFLQNLPSVHFGLTRRRYRFCFSADAWYDRLQEGDKEGDWNKLAGWGVGILPVRVAEHPWYSPKGWKTPHHVESNRIVWRPALEKNQLELALYTYQQGVREIVPYSRQVFTEIPYEWDLYSLAEHRPWYQRMGFVLGPYFGGSFPAFTRHWVDLTVCSSISI